jgi:hypothetical protein
MNRRRPDPLRGIALVFAILGALLMIGEVLCGIFASGGSK